MIEIQTDFQRQVIILKKELEDEKQARIKLEAEVKKIISLYIWNLNLHICSSTGADFKKVGQ